MDAASACTYLIKTESKILKNIHLYKDEGDQMKISVYTSPNDRDFYDVEMKSEGEILEEGLTVSFTNETYLYVVAEPTGGYNNFVLHYKPFIDSLSSDSESKKTEIWNIIGPILGIVVIGIIIAITVLMNKYKRAKMWKNAKREEENKAKVTNAGNEPKPPANKNPFIDPNNRTPVYMVPQNDSMAQPPNAYADNNMIENISPQFYPPAPLQTAPLIAQPGGVMQPVPHNFQIVPQSIDPVQPQLQTVQDPQMKKSQIVPAPQGTIL